MKCPNCNSEMVSGGAFISGTFTGFLGHGLSWMKLFFREGLNSVDSFNPRVSAREGGKKPDIEILAPITPRKAARCSNCDAVVILSNSLLEDL